ncbi:MAG: U32 family peptidase [Lachnospiraceae bacterium]|nr:U32 family peptidase [Lachnospiraceae bacterium]
MTAKKVELLAPVGSLEGFLGAIYAGADAVYVGGEKFSARAYADNLNTEALCNCIRYAHLFGRRVYLTLNTLIKEKEFAEIYDFVLPFYEAGLDGVILQDFGVLHFLKKEFPGLKLHASTQMAVTGPAIVPWCKEHGISRIVPARELSLSELKAIRDADIEVECFIHGAMCYCYSGQCLMSSVLGGRSGNRGRCAQPCRLPYSVEGEGLHRRESYPLSLKDMCTIDHIPELIQAGMSSFKIEGRMKKSEYAAGVTAIYRKYIDLYYSHPDQSLRISGEDRKILNCLYIRSDAQAGYLFRHNGQEMITGERPGYEEVPQELLDQIRGKYLGKKLTWPISMKAEFAAGQPAKLTLKVDLTEKKAKAESEALQKNVMVQEGIQDASTIQANAQGGMKKEDSSVCEVTVSGLVVEQAKKLSSDKDGIRRQLSKLGNTSFTLNELHIDMEDNVFLPNGMLNQLRRDGTAKLEEEIVSGFFPELTDRKSGLVDGQFELVNRKSETIGRDLEPLNREPEFTVRSSEIIDRYPVIDRQNDGRGLSEESNFASDKGSTEKPKRFELSALASTPEQMEAILTHPLADRFQYIYFTEKCFQENFEKIPPERRVLALPYILRLKDHARLEDLLHLAKDRGVCRLLIRNLEELGLIRQLQMEKDFILTADVGLYCWNQEAKELLLSDFDIVTLLYELGSGEISALWDRRAERIIYGYIPLMQTANCLYKTGGKCRRSDFGASEVKSVLNFASNSCSNTSSLELKSGMASEPEKGYHASAVLTDRFQKKFHVRTDCRYCFNTIYNSVPLSLHNKINARKPGNYRLQFTNESAREVTKLLDFYNQWLMEGRKPVAFPCLEFTTAFENRRVE